MPSSDMVRLHDVLGSQARERPHSVAVRDRDTSLTYEELDDRSSSLATVLVRRGVGPETPVGVCLERRVGLVVWFFAILKAGGAYVPLDPTNPGPRLAQIVADAGIEHLVADRPPGWLTSQPTILAADEPHQGPPTELPPGSGEGLAYIVHTSGSTGNPKGVMVSHANALSLIQAQRAADLVPPGSGVLGFAPIGFDASIWEILLAVGHGAPLELVESSPEALYEVRACVATLVPSVLDAADPGRTHFSALISAGEVLRADVAARWATAVSLRNAYGPAEATVCVTISDELKDFEQPPTIGRAIATSTAYVLDELGRPVADGEEGELWVGGAGVSRGYLNQPALTALRFRPDPWGPPGSRLYGTGDRARRSAEGEFTFLGRSDHQVKIDGRRVELGEIEAALASLAGVRSARVVFDRGDGGPRRLVAAVQLAPARTPDGVLTRLRELLPDYMVPAALVVVESFPRTANGKLDEDELLALADRPQVRAGAAAFAHPAQEIVAREWARVLGAPNVGPDDDFFALGGHSLLATRLVGGLRGMLDRPLPMRTLFRAPVLGDFLVAVLGDPDGRDYLDEDRAYWNELLAGAPSLRVPDGDVVELSLPEELASASAAWALGRSVPLLLVPVAALAQTVAERTGVPDVLLGVSCEGAAPEAAPVSMLLRIPVADGTPDERLAAASRAVLGAYLHKNVPPEPVEPAFGLALSADHRLRVVAPPDRSDDLRLSFVEHLNTLVTGGPSRA